MAFTDDDILNAIRQGYESITDITLFLTGAESSYGLSVKEQKEFYSRKQQVTRRIHSLHRHDMVEPISKNGSGVSKWKVVE